MIRLLLLPCLLSALLLGAFTLISQEYRTGVTNSITVERPGIAATLAGAAVEAPIHKAARPQLPQLAPRIAPVGTRFTLVSNRR